MKRKPPTLAKLKKIAWKLLSECIRREAADGSGYVQCYTCTWVGHWSASQAGHAIGGRTGAVLFEEDIIRPQCYRCNVPLHGNYGVFAARLIAENGENWYSKKLFDSRQIKKWSRVELLSLIEEYKARLAALDEYSHIQI